MRLFLLQTYSQARTCALLCAALGTLTLTLTACNIVAPVALIVAGLPKTKALYGLDRSKTYIILVDDLRSRLPKRSLRVVISETAEGELIRYGVLSDKRLISSAAAYRVIQDERWGQQISVVDIGSRVGADVVIYVTVDVWQLTRDGVSSWPSVTVRVMVTDVAENRRLWPQNETGFLFTVEPMDLRIDALPRSLAERSNLEQKLAKRLGTTIAQVFYKHESSKSAHK